FKRKDYRKAQKALERLSSVCEREAQRACAPIAYELSYYLGRSYEAQGQLAEAMNEFQRLEGQRGGNGGERRDAPARGRPREPEARPRPGAAAQEGPLSDDNHVGHPGRAGDPHQRHREAHRARRRQPEDGGGSLPMMNRSFVRAAPMVAMLCAFLGSAAAASS